MDVGFYLSELLMQRGEVNIPGLGNFERLRMSGYYDENERTFYPPFHRAKFTVYNSGIDTLADHIALQKHISLASASYFVEKYVSNIKQEALTGDVTVGNLGLFYTADDQLTFKPADKITDDNIFYGLEPVGIAKINGAVVEDIPVVTAEEVIEVPQAVEEVHMAVEEPPVVITEAPVAVVEPVVPAIVEEPEPAITTQPVVLENNYQAQPIEFYNRNDETAFNYVNTETTERRSPLRIFLIVVVIVLLLDTIILGLYRYEPDTFAKIAFWQNNTKPDDSVKQKAAVPVKVADTANTDSINMTDEPETDTVAKAAPVTKQAKAEKVAPVVAVKKADQPIIKKAEQPVVKQAVVAAKPAPVTATPATGLDTGALKPSDAVGTRRFEVYALTCKTMPTALRYAEKLRKKGLDPRLVTDAPGKLIHVTVGHFATEKEARAYAIKLEENGKVSTDAYPREIIPQKK